MFFFFICVIYVFYVWMICLIDWRFIFASALAHNNWFSRELIVFDFPAWMTSEIISFFHRGLFVYIKRHSFSKSWGEEWWIWGSNVNGTNVGNVDWECRWKLDFFMIWIISGMADYSFIIFLSCNLRKKKGHLMLFFVYIYLWFSLRTT